MKVPRFLVRHGKTEYIAYGTDETHARLRVATFLNPGRTPGRKEFVIEPAGYWDGKRGRIVDE